jgi:hypothetical protein
MYVNYKKCNTAYDDVYEDRGHLLRGTKGTDSRSGAQS